MWSAQVPVLLSHAPPHDLSELLLAIGAGLALFAVFIGLCLAPFLVWRRRARRRGYPGLFAYFRDLPRTDEEKLDAIDLTLKGGVICVLGLLIPPLVLIGLVPLYYGARKLMSVKLGVAGPRGDGPAEPSH